MQKNARFRWLLIAATSIGLVASASTFPSAQAASPDSPGYRVHDYADGQAMSILPPGENGLVNATDLAAFELLQTRPANSDDQLKKYNNLLYGYPSLTNAKLGSYFDDESFGVKPGDVTKTETPEPGVTIYRDGNDVPHVYGDTDQAAAFGAGYAQAEDRLFLMDVLRHYGEGTLASFLGGSCDFEQMDHDELLLAPYTKAQADAQVAAMAANNGAAGRLAKTMIDNYVAGVNAYVQATTVNLGLLPADYAAALTTPQPWSDSDVVAIAGLIGGIFGKGGGFEVADAGLRSYLTKRYGTTRGLKMFRDLDHQDDRMAPVTLPGKVFPYDKPTRKVDPSLTAIPDSGKAITGGPVDTIDSCGAVTPNPTAKKIITSLKAMPKDMSNALVVNGSHTASGHPVAVFGPQVSYFAPQILSELEIQSPSYSAEGASFPGTGLVELGRGQDYAWSATSAESDLIDQRVEKICNPAGGAPAAQGTSYVFDGKCVAMTHETFSETALPKPGGIGTPGTLNHQIYLTRHGVVQGWTTVRGKPVAIVNQRSTYNHDIDSVVGFLKFGMPKAVHDVKSWMAAANGVDYTFNWFYVDNRDTGYFTSGRDPVRRNNVDTALPTWGTGTSEWRGFLTQNQHVHGTNPKQGFFVSWNNKPAQGFASDGDYAYGQTYRSTMLVTNLKRQLKLTHNSVTRARVVQAMENTATEDLDGTAVMPLLLKFLNGHPHSAAVKSMLSQLKGWTADGSHRRKAKATDTQYAHASAIAISDELIPNLIEALYGRILGAGGTSNVGSTGGAMTQGFSVLPMQWVNTPNSGGAHLGSAYDGGYEGYLMTTLQQLLGKHPSDGPRAAFQAQECLGGAATCRKAISSALLKTYQALVTANGTSNVAAWTASTESKAANETMPAHDAIFHRALGIVGQPPIDWQNRPTFQQVVEFPRHRKR
jgi:acyl-homoserine lactone acylase PvdQ